MTSADDRPPTPQLDRALSIRSLSETIGEFVMEHLAGQGIVLARWMWEQRPCPEHWGFNRDGRLTPMNWLERGRWDEVEIDVWDCPCGLEMTVRHYPPPNPYPHARWELIQLDRSDGWMRDQLARFFGLDPDVMHDEQMRLLEYLRAVHAREHDKRIAALEEIREAHARGATDDGPARPPADG
jgi:hypothetical protein